MPNHPLTKSSNSDSRFITPLMNGHNSIETNDEYQEESTNLPEKMISMSVPQRQKQWAIDAAGVPHFLCLLSKRNHLLFACDKLGSIDLYQLDNNDSKAIPRHLRQFELFPGNSANPHPQIIETFTVYTPFIVVSARTLKLFL